MSDLVTSDPLRLPELLALRAFQDVGGLLGTLTAALELALEEAGGAAGANLRVAVKTAADLNRRARLLRAAWGPTGAGLDLACLDDLALGIPAAHRVRLDLSALPAGTAFAPALSRVLLNLALLAAECLPRGGALTLAEAGPGTLIATIAGPRAAWPDGFAAVLVDGAAALAALTDPHRLQGPLLALLARRLGVRLSLLMAAGGAPAGGGRRRSPPPLLIESPIARPVG
jgi:histidine phosphotransferase ChpT